MGIDRTEGGDEIRHAPERGGTDTAVLADPERRVATHRLYRALVDHSYGMDRDAWSQVLPALRAAWEEHKERYPERTRPAPRTQPDGAWVADGDRKLSPEQNAEVDRGYARIREVGKNVIVPGMRSVGAEDASRQLAGFEHRFKGEDRLKEKIADRMRSKGRTPSEAPAGIVDAVRFTFQYDETSYTAGVRNDVERLEGQRIVERIRARAARANRAGAAIPHAPGASVRVDWLAVHDPRGRVPFGF